MISPQSSGRSHKLGLAVLTAAVALLAAECAARRLSLPPEYVQNLRFDPVFGFRSRPDDRMQMRDENGPAPWSTNSSGFLGPEFPEPDAPREGQRLLFLGDSFLNVWGVRLENAMTEITAARLTAAGTPAVAWNVSCNGWGTAQERIALREFGPRIRPDVVVLCVFPSNDLANNEIELADRTYVSTGDCLRPYLVLVPAHPDGELELAWSQPLRSFLRRHSRLFGLLEQRILARAEKGRKGRLHPDEPPPTAVASRMRSGLSAHEALEFLRSHPPDHPWERAWKTTEALIAATQREAQALGARFLMVVIPHHFQVQRDPSWLALERKVRRIDARGLDGEHDWNGAEARLARFAAERGIEAVLLLERLRELVRIGEPVYQDDGGHLNTRGHALAGQVIAEHLLAPTPASDPAPTGAPVEAF